MKRGELEEARERYLDVLAEEGSAPCAIEGLRLVAVASRAAAKAQSATGEASEEDTKSRVERAADWTTNFLKLIGAAGAAIFVLVGLVLVGIVLWRRRRASLNVEAFADGGVEQKVGSAVAALVEQRLTGISQTGTWRGARDGYMLDLVVADVELVAASKSLEKALGGLAEASQFKLVVAVLSLLDRAFGDHLVAKGELAPKGSTGFGLLVALQSEKEGLQARGALWKESRLGAKNPTPYYELAEPAAAWVQYEAARCLDSLAERLTGSGKSFSLLSQGLAATRAGNLKLATRRYVEALDVDRENVGALLNLSLILARYEWGFDDAVVLLVRAMTVLRSRYEEMR